MANAFDQFDEKNPFDRFDNEPINPVMAKKKAAAESGSATLHKRSQDHRTRMANDPYYRTAYENGAVKNALSQAGGVLYGLGYLGPKQILGKAKPGEVEDYKASMRGSIDAPGGSVGAVLGYGTAGVPAFLLPGANTITGAALIGGGLGALEPVAEGESRTWNAATGGAMSALVPAAVRGTRFAKAALVDPYTEKGKLRIVGSTLNQSASNRDKAISNLMRNRGATPGFNPTAGQAAMDDGIASLERAARAIDPGGFQSVNDEQMAALVKSLRQVSGTPEARQAAVEAREQATEALYKQAKQAVVTDDGTLSKLLNRPSMGNAMNRAVNLAKERGEYSLPKRAPTPAGKMIDTNKDDLVAAVRKLGGINQDSFDAMFGQSVRNDFKFAPNFTGPVFAKGKGLGVDEMARELYQNGYLAREEVGDLLDLMVDSHMYDKPAFSVFKQEVADDPLSDAINSLVAKMSEKQTAAAQPQSLLKEGKISGKALHDLKMGLDDAIGVPGQGGLLGAERGAAMGTKQEYLDWLESKIPAYGQARTTYADMSKPINQMDIGQELYKRFVPALADGDLPFKSRADSFAQALRNGDQLARSTTGMKGATLQGVMTPQQMGLLNGVLSDSQMRAAAQSAGRGVGSDTVQKMAMTNVLNQAGIPTWMQSIGRVPGGWLRTVGDIIYTKNDDALRAVLADVIKDPKLAAQAMQMAKRDPSGFMRALQTLSQGSALAIPSTVESMQQ